MGRLFMERLDESLSGGVYGKHGLIDMVVLGIRLGLMILEVFSNLIDSVTLKKKKKPSTLNNRILLIWTKI